MRYIRNFMSKFLKEKSLEGENFLREKALRREGYGKSLKESALSKEGYGECPLENGERNGERNA